MSRKTRKRRMSRSMRFVRETEAVMLGEYIEPYLRSICWYVPTTLAELKKLGSDVFSVACALECYEPMTNIAHRSYTAIAATVLLHLSVVSIENAPRTIDGLLELGTYRLRYLIGLCLPEARSLFILPRRQRDLPDEVIAQRLLSHLKQLDTKAGRIWECRPTRFTPEELKPAKEKPPPVLPAKLRRLVQKRRQYLATYVTRMYQPVGSNTPHSVRRGHVGNRTVTLRCGCKGLGSIPVGRFFHFQWRENICSIHNGSSYGIRHVSELMRVPKERVRTKRRLKVHKKIQRRFRA